MTVTTTIFYQDRVFRPGKAMTEWTIQDCDATTCQVIFPLLREQTRIRR
jgi:hypothetical protein